jgi:hypothetical protein
LQPALSAAVAATAAETQPVVVSLLLPLLFLLECTHISTMHIHKTYTIKIPRLAHTHAYTISSQYTYTCVHIHTRPARRALALCVFGSLVNLPDKTCEEGLQFILIV